MDPKYVNAYIRRGIAYNSLGQLAKFDKSFENDVRDAIQDFSKAIALNPQSILAYNNRSSAYKNLGMYEFAIQDITKTIELDPKSASGYCNRGIIYKDLGNYKFAIRDLTKAIEIAPNYSWAYYNRGQIFDKLGYYKKVVEDYNAFLNYYQEKDNFTNWARKRIRALGFTPKY